MTVNECSSHDLRREASRASDSMQSFQADAENAIRVARRAACRLKVMLLPDFCQYATTLLAHLWSLGLPSHS